MKIRENVPISTLTTMRLGGPARFVLDVEEKSDIPAAYKFAEEKNLPVFVLGAGANSLGHDEGFAGVIIRNQIKGISHEHLEHCRSFLKGDVADLYYIKAAAGTVWDDVVAYAVNLNLTGIEALSKIPGLAGAAPVQNIGAYGQDLSGSFVYAEVYDNFLKRFRYLNADSLNFAYRHSNLNTTDYGRYFVYSITLELRKGEMKRPFYNSIETYISEHQISDFSPSSIRKIVSNIRAAKLPDPAEIPSAGSFFKNIHLDSRLEIAAAKEKGYPVYENLHNAKINSAWLIEQVGLKGASLHGFRVSETAPLVLINESAKSFEDLARARAEIREKVEKKFGYFLEQEPVEITPEGLVMF